MFVFCRKWFGCLCANSEYDSSSSPAGKLTLSPEGQSQRSLASPRIRAPARTPAAAAAVGHADSAHSLNHQRRVEAIHKEGHDAVISWLEKADVPSPDDHVAPVRKVCYYFCMMKLAPHTPIFPALTVHAHASCRWKHPADVNTSLRAAHSRRRRRWKLHIAIMR